jgi:acetyl esterase/lipase
MSRRFAFLLPMLSFLGAVATTITADAPLIVDLWPGAAPDELKDVGPERVRMSPALEHRQVEVTNSTRMITGVTKPTLTIQRPANAPANGTAVLIFPGGGYWDLYWQLEGEEVADWLNSLGITGVLVKYRVPRQPDEKEGEPARRPLQDAQRAMRIVRSRAAEWGIDPKRIGTIGFSAGGHLSLAMATNFEKQTYKPVDELDQISCRPDFAIGAYSGYLKMKDTVQLTPGLEVPTNAPPVFLVHGSDDIISPPGHSVVMYLALRKAGIPAELHLYAGTTHDFGVRRSERPYGQWTDACARWMRDQGFLRNSK